MKTIVCETLFALSSCAAILMLCCAVVHCADLLSIDFENMHDAVEESPSLYRSGLFFYTNAALCFGGVFLMFLLD